MATIQVKRLKANLRKIGAVDSVTGGNPRASVDRHRLSYTDQYGIRRWYTEYGYARACVKPLSDEQIAELKKLMPHAVIKTFFPGERISFTAIRG